jgi:hypothetical protein
MGKSADDGGGLTPLAYMLRVMRNPKAEPARRDEMAKLCAPYLHRKLGVEPAAEGGEPEEKDVEYYIPNFPDVRKPPVSD